MRYPIIITPDERLRRQAKPVKVITDELVQLLDDLYETMVAHDGIGIAAPQVGKNLQVAIVEVEEDDRFEMINPEIIASSGESLDVEGCLSIPHTFEDRQTSRRDHCPLFRSRRRRNGSGSIRLLGACDAA